MTLRTKKVEKELQSIIANYLLTTFAYKNDIIISINTIKVSPDLKLASVYYSYYSPITDEIDSNEVLEVLKEERIKMQESISDQLKMKFTPKLRFFYDDSIKETFRIQDKIKSLGIENKSN